MIAANYQSVKKDFADFYAKVADKNETVIVSKDGGSDIVILRLDRYNELTKEERNKAYLEKIDRGIRQLEAGFGQNHDIIEVEDD